MPATAANSGANNTGGTGGFAILDSDCDGLVQDDAYLNTPSIDLSGVPSPILQFNSDYIDLDSIADVDISTDGGSNWTNVWERAGADDPGPSTQTLDISGQAGGQADVRARFHFHGLLGLVVAGGQRPAGRSRGQLCAAARAASSWATS